MKNVISELKKSIGYILLALVALAGWWHHFSGNHPVAIDKTVRIAYDDSWMPLELLDKKWDVTGFSLDLVRAVAKQQSFSVDLMQVESNDLLAGLDRRYYDAILSPLSLRDLFAEKYISSNPYFEVGPVLAVPRGSKIRSIDDLSGKTIGRISSDLLIPSLHKHSSINILLYEYNDRDQMFRDLVDGKIDGLIYNALPTYEMVSNNYTGKIEIVTQPLTKEGLRLIAKNNKQSQELIKQFNEGLKAIGENGVYESLIKKWSLIDSKKIQETPALPTKVQSK